MTSALGRATSWPGVAPPASLQGQGLKSLLCRGEAAAAGKGSVLPRTPGWVEKGGSVAFRNDVVKGMGTVVFVLFPSGLLGAGARMAVPPWSPTRNVAGSPRECPRAPRTRGGSRGFAQGSSRTSVGARIPLPAREQEGQREPSPLRALPPAPSPRRPGPTGRPPVAVGRADGTAEAREGCLFLTSGLPRCSPPRATGCPGLGAATQECPARTCGGAPVQKWEVRWGGLSLALHLKRTEDPSP